MPKLIKIRSGEWKRPIRIASSSFLARVTQYPLFFSIFSMTKSLTAAAMMSLVDEGKVDLKATLKSVTPSVALIGPRVVIVNNGPRKGLGGPSPGAQKAASIHYDRLAKVPGVEGIWQGHRSLLDPDHNTAEEMIANLEDTAQCQGHWLKASVSRDGTFTVTNGRNQYSRTYKP